MPRLDTAPRPETAPQARHTAQANVLAQLLQTILAAVQPQAGSGAPSHTQSLAASGARNRFHNGHANGDYARPFVFGVDDALIAALIGPVVQVLPQLMNAANQRRAQITQSNNALITSILSDVNRRLLLDRLIEAQRQAPAAGAPAAGAQAPGVNLDQLIQLLQQAPPAGNGAATAAQNGAAATGAGATGSTGTAATGQQPAAPLSIGRWEGPTTLSTRAVVSFTLAPTVTWNRRPMVLFAKGQPMRLTLQLNVTDPVPAKPLPKAIVAVTFKDCGDHTTLFEKTFKQKDVAANTAVPLSFSADEIARLPVSRPIAIVAEMRWPTRDGIVHKALGSADIVVVGRWFFKNQGQGALPSTSSPTYSSTARSGTRSGSRRRSMPPRGRRGRSCGRSTSTRSIPCSSRRPRRRTASWRPSCLRAHPTRKA